MNFKSQRIIINIEDSKYLSWQICLKNKLKTLKSSNIEIDCKSLDLSCTDISEAIAIAIQFQFQFNFNSISIQFRFNLKFNFNFKDDVEPLWPLILNLIHG